MGLLSGMVWGQLTQLPHPAANPKGCINCHRRRHCTACADICPAQVMEQGGKVESWSACTDCGKCVTACPTRAIGPSERQLRELLELRQGEEERLWLGCEQSPRALDKTFPCLCSLSWEALAWLSFYRVLMLDLSPCQGCEQAGCRTLLGEQLQQLHFFLGQDRFQRRVVLLHSAQGEQKADRTLNRRELFRHGAEWTVQGAKSLLRQAPLLNPEELQLDGLSIRSMLHREMKDRGGTYCWKIPDFTGTCIGCGDCVEQCPSGALRISEADTELILDPKRCTACGGCAVACRQKCISGQVSAGLGDLSPVKLGSVEKLRCRDCGAEMKGRTSNGRCPACARKRMNEALRRAGT